MARRVAVGKALRSALSGRSRPLALVSPGPPGLVVLFSPSSDRRRSRGSALLCAPLPSPPPWSAGDRRSSRRGGDALSETPCDQPRPEQCYAWLGTRRAASNESSYLD